MSAFTIAETFLTVQIDSVRQSISKFHVCPLLLLADAKIDDEMTKIVADNKYILSI